MVFRQNPILNLPKEHSKTASMDGTIPPAPETDWQCNELKMQLNYKTGLSAITAADSMKVFKVIKDLSIETSVCSASIQSC